MTSHHYRVANLSPGHGFQQGRLLSLYGELDGVSQPLVVAQVVEAYEHSLELAALWIEPRAGPVLELDEVPPGHHFGGRIGQIIHDVRRDRILVNMGADHGLELGDTYFVLGDPYPNTDLGGASLGRREIGIVQVAALDHASAVVEVLQGEAPHNTHVLYAGFAELRPPPVLKVAVAQFSGDYGGAYSVMLTAALGSTLEGAEGDIELTRQHEVIIDHGTGGERQARALGIEMGAKVVVWGSASSMPNDVIHVLPEVTFVDSHLHEPVDWAPVSLGLERLQRRGPDPVSSQLQGLAAYLAGLLHYANGGGEHHGASRAVVYLRTAIELGTTRDADNAQLWLFYCLEQLGQWVGAEAVARTIESQGRARNDDRRLALGLYMRARMELRVGAPGSALRLALDAAELFDRLGDRRERAIALGKIADIYYEIGALDDALYIWKESQLRTYGDLRDERNHALTRNKIARIHSQRGEFDLASSMVEELLVVYDRLDCALEYVATLDQIGDIHQARGNFDEALRIREQEQLPRARELEDVRAIAVAQAKIAELHYLRGRFDKALRMYTQTLDVYETLGDVRARAVTQGKIAKVHRARGELDLALHLLRAQLPSHEKLGKLREWAVTMGEISSIHVERGEFDVALQIIRDDELPVFTRLGEVREVAIAKGKIADVHHARREYDAALRLREQDELPVYQRLGARRELVICEAKIAFALISRGQERDRARASDLLRRSLAAAREMELAEADEISAFMGRFGLEPDVD